MSVLDTRVPPFKAPPILSFNWDSWRGGLNTLLKPTELKDDQLAQADNLLLTGGGIPSKRYGTSNYFLAGATGSVRLVDGLYLKDGTNQAIALTDQGILVKQSGASYTQITGASFASGYNAHGVTIQNNYYVVNGVDKLTKYNGTSLTRFNALSTPVITGATLVSGASINPSKPYSYIITALSPVGETLGSTPASIVSGPQNLTTSLIRLSWTAISAASGDLIGYQIYGRDPGNETFIAKVDQSTLKYDDNGTIQPQLLTSPPTANTTDGPIAKFVIPHKDKMILAGLSNEPSRIMWSGGGANVEKFHWSYGGGYLDISKDDGDTIRGIKSFQDNIVVFKERSIWSVNLVYNATVGIVIPTLTLITNSRGAVSHRAIQVVENDLVFLSRKGVYVLGNEPLITSTVLRTSEVSINVRPTMESMNQAQLSNAAAVYFNNKYILTYPSSGAPTSNSMIIYDRERLSWMGPWNIGANGFSIYYDSSSAEHLLYGDTSDAYVTEMSDSFKDDKGVAIPTFLRTKKEDLKDWSLFKTINDVFFYFRSILGSVSINVRLEGTTGETTTVSSFTITSSQGSSGMGTDQMGMYQLGTSKNAAAVSSNDAIKWDMLNKTARAFQFEVQTNNRNDSYELVAIRGDNQVLPGSSRPSSWRV